MHESQHWDGSDTGKHGSEGESELSLLPEQKPKLPWRTSLEKPVKSLKQNQGILEEKYYNCKSPVTSQSRAKVLHEIPHRFLVLISCFVSMVINMCSVLWTNTWSLRFTAGLKKNLRVPPQAFLRVSQVA